MTLREIDAEDLLREDVAIAEDDVRMAVTVKLSQNMFDALVIFVYNIKSNIITDEKKLLLELRKEYARRYVPEHKGLNS